MMKKGRWFIKILILLFLMHDVFSHEYFPKGCKAWVIKNNLIDIKGKKNNLIFFHNISKNHIWLANRNVTKWTVELKPGLWNVFYLPQNNAAWRCIEAETGHEQQVSCHDVIAMCQWSAIAPEQILKQSGIWVIENQSVVVAKAYLERMGWLFNQVSSKLAKDKS